jgi:hypothetical protein
MVPGIAESRRLTLRVIITMLGVDSPPSSHVPRRTEKPLAFAVLNEGRAVAGFGAAPIITTKFKEESANVSSQSIFTVSGAGADRPRQ